MNKNIAIVLFGIVLWCRWTTVAYADCGPGPSYNGCGRTLAGPSLPSPAVALQTPSCLDYYPPLARRLNQEGRTVVAVHVDEVGAVRSVDVIQSSGYDILDEAASACITQTWRFKPAIVNGNAVRFVKQYIVDWKLQ